MKVLEEAIHIVEGRKETYGSPLDNLTQTAALWSAYFHQKFQAKDVAMMMLLVKVSRLSNSPDHRDSMVDMAGYTDCYAEVMGKNDGND